MNFNITGENGEKIHNRIQSKKLKIPKEIT